MNRYRSLISVVVLSYNRPALLREALTSLCNQTYAPLEIIVVDNRSESSEEIALMSSEFFSVRLVRNFENSGYAAGMNRGIAEASGDSILLTEDDIILDRNCIHYLAEYARGVERAGLISPLLYNRREGTIRCAGGELSLGGIYLRKTYGEGHEDVGQYTRPFEVTYIDGAIMFARTDFLKMLGGFREEFFMYVEAVEICARAIKAGAPLTVVPDAKAYHAEPPLGANSSTVFAFHRYKNLFSLYLLHAPARCLPEFFCRYALLALVRALLSKGEDARALIKSLLWVSGRLPSLLRERRSACALNVMNATKLEGLKRVADQAVAGD